MSFHVTDNMTGTHDKALVRIMISRLHVDLYEIADSYNTIFGKRYHLLALSVGGWAGRGSERRRRERCGKKRANDNAA